MFVVHTLAGSRNFEVSEQRLAEDALEKNWG